MVTINLQHIFMLKRLLHENGDLSNFQLYASLLKQFLKI